MKKYSCLLISLLIISFSASAQIKYKTNLLKKLGSKKADNEKMEGKLLRLEYVKGTDDEFIKLHWSYTIKNKTDKEIKGSKKEHLVLTVYTRHGEQYTFDSPIPDLLPNGSKIGEQSADIAKDEVIKYEIAIQEGKNMMNNLFKKKKKKEKGAK